MTDTTTEAELIERLGAAFEAIMGPVFGSPEYLADPVKLARAEKRRRDGALAYARATLPILTTEIEAAVLREREACIEACLEQRESFATSSYSVGQPASSFSERFACNQCIAAIRDRTKAGV